MQAAIRTSPVATPAEKDGERPEPVARGGQYDVPCARRGQRARNLRALVGRCRCEARAQPFAPRVGADLPAGLRIDEPQDAGVRQLLFAGVAHLDRNDLVPAGELDQRTPPVEWAAKVADDDDDRTLLRHRARPAKRLAQ